MTRNDLGSILSQALAVWFLSMAIPALIAIPGLSTALLGKPFTFEWMSWAGQFITLVAQLLTAAVLWKRSNVLARGSGTESTGPDQPEEVPAPFADFRRGALSIVGLLVCMGGMINAGRVYLYPTGLVGVFSHTTRMGPSYLTQAAFGAAVFLAYSYGPADPWTASRRRSKPQT